MPAFVVGSVGPLGRALQPFGQVAVADAEGWFQTTAEGLLEGGVDGFILETFQDLNEILAALRAVRRVSADLPVIAQMTFGTDGKTLYGHSPALAVPALRQAGADVVGVNCGVGPQVTLEVLEEMVRAAAGMPVSAMPNAGLPHRQGGRFQYLASPGYFGEFAARAVEAGATLVGGCCGTTPAHVRAMRERLASHLPAERLAPGAEVRVLERAPAPVEAGPGGPEPPLLARLREKFLVSVEIDPPRGVSTRKVIEGARLMARRGVDAVNVADSPMARVRMSAQRRLECRQAPPTPHVHPLAPHHAHPASDVGLHTTTGDGLYHSSGASATKTIGNYGSNVGRGANGAPYDEYIDLSNSGSTEWLSGLSSYYYARTAGFYACSINNDNGVSLSSRSRAVFRP